MHHRVIVLDDEAALRAGDPSGILEAFLGLGGQLRDSYEKGTPRISEPASSITFCGMGGSAAAGDVAIAAFRDRMEVPAVSVRGYELPGHCGPGSLVVCVSYSGETEETLAAYGEAVKRGCSVFAVCSGGTLAERAGDDGVPVAVVPSDAPAPRAALGYLTGAVLGALPEVIPDPAPHVDEAVTAVDALSEEIGPAVPQERNEAKSIASWIGDRVPVVWGSEGVGEVAAWRWKCALNENAKVPAFSSALPELDHHEVAGWSPRRGASFALVVLRDREEHPSVGPRVEATLAAVAESGLGSREVWARGRSPLARALSLIQVGDAASAYHALARRVDPTPIEAIQRVKEAVERP